MHRCLCDSKHMLAVEYSTKHCRIMVKVGNIIKELIH